MYHGSSYLVYFSFSKKCFFSFLSRWSLSCYYMKAHKTHKISTKPSLHSSEFIYFCLSTSQDLNRAMLSLESCNSLTGLLLPYLSILSTVTIVSHLNGISDLVSPQLKTLYWVPISFSPDKALHLMACVTSLTSPHTVSCLPYHLAALLFIELLRQTLGSGHMHLPFSLPETFFSE